MDRYYFNLGNTDDNRFVKILRIFFGLACIIMAAWWINYDLNSGKSNWSLYLTIAFLILFGIYQIWFGTGHASRFIVISGDKLVIRKNQILPSAELNAAELSKIEIFPLSIVFHKSSSQKFILRLGTVNYETNEKIVDELIRFAENNNIEFELREEKIY
ncbi:MAG TPA: hypothetical protein VHO46_07660 [Bacteroidales bacterium]|nr:hypothetical protein [Bacteroidales bacterium]